MRLWVSISTPAHPSRPQELPMLPNLPANRRHIRRKPPTGHHPRMKIAIRTLRLTKRHLHVNPQLPHNPKTLAHRRRITICHPSLTRLSYYSPSPRFPIEFVWSIESVAATPVISRAPRLNVKYSN